MRGARPSVPAGARALAGTSFKHEHLGEILAAPPRAAFFEVHAENYMGAGGPPHRALEALRERLPVSVHGVGLSIGGEALDERHLERLCAVVRRYEPMLVSEHLAWSSHGGVFYNDLLPLPYDRPTLDRVCRHVDRVQHALGRTILLENPSTYVAFERSTMTEAAFLAEVLRRTGCGLLLDVNNVFVSATNHRESAEACLAALPLDRVGEIHLAGHARHADDDGGDLLVDSHDRPVDDAVWRLYCAALARTGPVPTLVEWDSELPSWPVLRAQAEQALRCQEALVHPDEAAHVAG